MRQHDCCVSEPESDTADKVQHFDAKIDVYENDDAVLEKQYTVLNDKEARGELSECAVFACKF